MPLTEHLTNRQFGERVGTLNRLDGASDRTPAVALCKCGYRTPVAAPRRFVNQTHYDRWRS